ncbi:MAG TPA: glycosyltransferase [Phormidium sp.]
MPLISVIIPLYNSEKTIRETLESVFQQTFSDFEIIAVNDGSKDSTLDIITSIQDPRLKIFSYPNGGISVSRNQGLSHAQGEFIAFLDHDDLWTREKLESQLKALQENPQAAVAYSWVDLIDEANQFIRPVPRTRVTDNAYEKLLLSNFVHTASNPLIRKEALIKVGGFDESITGPDDWDLFLRLAASYQFVTVPQVQILYRMTTGAVSANVFKIEAAYLRMLERAFDRASESLQHLKKKSLAKLYLFLTFRGLEAPSGRQSSVAAMRCLWLAVKYDPSLLQRRTILVALFKISVVALLPSWQSQNLLKKVKSFKNQL